MSSACSEFAAEIRKHFEFLFRDKGFVIAFEEASGLDRCLLILESGRFRVKLYRAPDEVNLQLGLPSAPSIWGEKQDDKTHWHFLRTIVGFLNQDKEAGLRVAVPWADRTHAVQMSDLSRILQAHYQEIEELFGQGRFPNIRQEYESYLETLNRAIMQQYKIQTRRTP
jgi:hypothetical protein